MPQPQTAGTTAARARIGTVTITYSVMISSELLCRPMAVAGSPAWGSASGGAVGRVRAGADKETPERYLARARGRGPSVAGLRPRNLRDRKASCDRAMAAPSATRQFPDGCLWVLPVPRGPRLAPGHRTHGAPVARPGRVAGGGWGNRQAAR